MTNRYTIITTYNRRIIDKESQNTNQTPNCNCDKKECALQGECLTSAIVYQAEVKTSEETKTYIGITGRNSTINPLKIKNTNDKKKQHYQKTS